MDQKIILPENKESASMQTVTGWVSANGYFYGDKPNSEYLARYDGSTHRKCDCGETIKKNSYCKKCHTKKMDAVFEDMEKTPWDGEGFVVDFDTDKYFTSWDEVSDYCHDHGILEKDLRLCHCVPSTLPRFDVNDFLCDIMPEDSDVDDIPADILSAADELNKAFRESSPISWVQGDTAVLIENQ